MDLSCRDLWVITEKYLTFGQEFGQKVNTTRNVFPTEAKGRVEESHRRFVIGIPPLNTERFGTLRA